MQLDMHYYGTYAMARAAGLKPAVCKTIATCAQFVDDNAHSENIEFLDGGRVDIVATAHHVASISNIDPKDQRRVWVPFHFLPGNQGDSFSERLLCRKDSDIAKEMVNHHLSKAKDSFGAHLIGIAAHVYADTFSHYGFSGVSSRRNKVENDSFEFDQALEPEIKDYITGKAERFFRDYRVETGFLANVKSWLAETFSGALGHGAVATYPDRPYLKWSFEYEYPQKNRVRRDNPKTFLEGCAALHKMFSRFAKANPESAAGDGVNFAEIKAKVKQIIEVQGKKQVRVDQWKKAARNGHIANGKYQIPDYTAMAWLEEIANLNRSKDSRKVLQTDIYHFFQAAALHRNFILRDLLPRYDLVVG